jgi:hypothetical protein
VSDRDPPISPVLAGLASPIPRRGLQAGEQAAIPKLEIVIRDLLHSDALTSKFARDPCTCNPAAAPRTPRKVPGYLFQGGARRSPPQVVPPCYAGAEGAARLGVIRYLVGPRFLGGSGQGGARLAQP